MMRASQMTHSGMTLRVQLILLQALIVSVVTLIAGVTAGIIQAHTVRDAYEDRMLAVAQSIASMPVVLDAFDDANPSATVQPLAETIRRASDLTYVVVADANGIRFSHPNPERIGQKVSTDASVPLSGEIYMGTQTGTLGPSWRVKVPVFDGSDVIGTVSVGILESQGTGEFVGNLTWIIGAMLAAVVLGLFGSAWVTSVIRRRIHLLEPHEITALVRNQETTLHGLSEGVITVDASGTITLANDAAARLLGAEASELTGARAADVLDDELRAVLRDGEDAGRPVIVGSHVLVARGPVRGRAARRWMPLCCYAITPSCTMSCAGSRRPTPSSPSDAVPAFPRASAPRPSTESSPLWTSTPTRQPPSSARCSGCRG